MTRGEGIVEIGCNMETDFPEAASACVAQIGIGKVTIKGIIKA